MTHFWIFRSHSKPDAVTTWICIILSVVWLCGAVLFLVFCLGCSVPVTVQRPKMPPPLPKRAVPAIKTPYVVPPMTNVDLPDFRYAVNPCLYTWTLQGSSNLIDWVDVDNIGGTCPITNVYDATNTVPCYFFRMKGAIAK